VRSAVHVVEFDKAMGAMCGMALGDSLGHMFEFLPALDAPTRSSHFFDVNSSVVKLSMKCFSKASNQFGIELGQWTDDASMGLCVADSLLSHRAFDGADQRVRFWNWWNQGYNNAFRKDSRRSDSIGLGGNISKSLDEMQYGKKPSDVYSALTEDAGNGSLMRFAPIAVFGRNAGGSRIEPAVYEIAKASSYTTHPGIIAAEACAFLCHVIIRAFEAPRGVEAKPFLDNVCDEYLKILAPRQSGWGVDQIRELVSSVPASEKEASEAYSSSIIDEQSERDRVAVPEK
jgi:ADP-ribosylglycohydrolase